MTGEEATGDSAGWRAILVWADTLAATIATRHDHQYIAVIVGDEANQLQLAGQRSSVAVDLAVFIPGETAIPLDSICGRVFRTGVPTLLADVGMDPDYHPFLGALMRSELAIPIRIDDLIVGVVNLESPLFSAFDVSDMNDVLDCIAEAADDYPTGWETLEASA
jgi:hypothetical protein